MMLSIGSSSFGQQPQSQILTIPPNSIKYNSSTPFTPGVLSLPIGDYHGGTTTNPSNCWYDESGNLMFFINDANVYDGSGLLIGQLRTPAPDEAPIFGTTEVVVIPVPGHCKQFYLVSGYYASAGIGYAGCVNGGWPQPYYAVLDMNVAHPSPTLEGDMIFNSNARGSFTTPSASLIAGNIGDVHNGTLHFAVTPLRLSTSDRLLFVSLSNFIVVYTVTSTGIVPSGNSNLLYSNVTNGTDGSTGERNELEVVLLPNNTYRLAASYTNPLALPSAANTIYISDFNLSGTQIIGTVHTFGLSQVYSVAPVVKGLEFSPNGQYLFITHHVYPYMQYINVGVSGLIPISLSAGNAIDFQDTQIEMGYDGKMYFYGNNGSGNKRLATLSNPNSGFVLSNWVDPGSGSMYNVNVPLGTGCDPSNTDVNHALYLLPDQIDGEIYSNMYPTVTVTPNPTTICAGTCTTLSYTSTNNDPVQVTYKYGKLIHGPYTYTAGNFGSWCPAATQTYSVVPVIPTGSGYCPSTTLITINVDNVVLNPGFTIQSNTTSATVFTVSATATTDNAYINSVGGGYWWQVCHVDNNGNCLDQIVTNPSTWWNNSNPTINTFPTYNGTAPLGTFYRGETYQISRGVWKNCQTWSGISSTISWCIGCREAKTETRVLSADEVEAMAIQKGLVDINNSSELSLEVYPNPSNGLISVNSTAAFRDNVSIQVVNMIGQIIDQRETESGILNMNFDLRNYPKGMYLIKVLSGSKILSKKVLVE